MTGPLHASKAPLPSLRGASFFNAALIALMIAALFTAAAPPSSADGTGPATLPEGGGEFEPAPAMLLFPDVSRSKIVFLYAGDLWTVDKAGGVAEPLASAPGREIFPKFSPDGKTIAFTGNYDGNRDIYTVPAAGGAPFRVTHHPATEILSGWTPEGDLLFYAMDMEGLAMTFRLYRVSAAGGLPEALPPPYGAEGAISPDGRTLAYTPFTRDFRSWKRYCGGWASDIRLFDLETGKSRRLTHWKGTDTFPMWHGADLFYLSDRGPKHKLNIWVCHTGTDAHEQVTHFADFDVKWPSIGPGDTGEGEIVFQKGPGLWLLDIGDGSVREVKVAIPGARPKIRVQRKDAAKLLQAWNISATGKRAVVQARGDIWTLAAEHGPARNLTRTSGVAERDPAWSPDGRWIAYFSDATGEYALYITQSDGKGETRRLTEGSATFFYRPIWSPDSKRILFTDKAGVLYLVSIEGGKPEVIDKDPRGRFVSAPSWSKGGDWIAYARFGEERRFTAIYLYDVHGRKRTQVTSGFLPDASPVFDRKGDFLYFIGSRVFTPTASEFDYNAFAYTKSRVILAAPLRADVPSPWIEKSDEEKPVEKAEKETKKEAKKGMKAEERKKGDETEKAEDDEKEKAKPKETKPLKIDLENFEERVLRVPVPPGEFGSLAVNDKNQLVYTRSGSGIKLFDPADEKKEEKTVLAGGGGFVISGDGKKLLVLSKNPSIMKAAAGAKGKTVPTRGMDVWIDPPVEWRQVFTEAWRLYRDFFYDARMHGLDWKALRERYGALLPDCATREDVSYLIGEMIGELNVGHAYYFPSPEETRAPSVPVGLLGADFEIHEGAFRFKTIYRGSPSDVDSRSPLLEPGVDVKAGDYLLAVNGVPLDTAKDPWAAFVGLAGKTVTLLVSEKPLCDETAREVTVKTLKSDSDLRYRAWVKHNRFYVEKKSGGLVGYIYIPDTGWSGRNDFFRQFYGQVQKKALIIDERWNKGGFPPQAFTDVLSRRIDSFYAGRDGRDTSSPYWVHQGPKCMLINGMAGSGGDNLPWQFRHARIGKLIGMRTWGGLVGFSGFPPGLIDGSRVWVPNSAFYKTDGTWGVEGYGVAPDIEVIDDPAKMAKGADPQLDAAVALMLKEIKTYKYITPKRPPPRDRTGMGVPEEER